jgi:tetratricopeptide (TPR) repeat protein
MQASRPLGDAYSWIGDTESAERWLRRSLTLARELGDGTAEALSLCSLGYVSVWLGQTDAAKERFEPALAFFRAAGDRHSQAIVLTGLAQALRIEGRLDEAAAALEMACTVFARSGEGFWESVAQLALAHVRSSRGDRDGADRCLRRTIERCDQLGNRHFATLARYRQVLLHLDHRTPAEAAAELEACVAALRELGLREADGAARRLEGVRALEAAGH